MPIYDYKCSKCYKKFERLVKDKDELVACECGYIASREFPDTFNFELKGDGWFKDGYSKDKPK